MARILDLGTLKAFPLHNESDATTHRTPKALHAKYEERGFRFAEAFGVRTRPRVALGAAALDFPKQPVVAGSAAAPNHGDRSRQAAAHVEREKSFHVLNLATASLF